MPDQGIVKYSCFLLKPAWRKLRRAFCVPQAAGGIAMEMDVDDRISDLRISDLIRIEVAAAMADLTTGGFRGVVARGEAPAPVRVGSAALWRRSEVEAWLETYRKRGKYYPAKAWAPENSRETVGGEAS